VTEVENLLKIYHPGHEKHTSELCARNKDLIDEVEEFWIKTNHDLLFMEIVPARNVKIA